MKKNISKIILILLLILFLIKIGLAVELYDHLIGGSIDGFTLVSSEKTYDDATLITIVYGQYSGPKTVDVWITFPENALLVQGYRSVWMKGVHVFTKTYQDPQGTQTSYRWSKGGVKFSINTVGAGGEIDITPLVNAYLKKSSTIPKPLCREYYDGGKNYYVKGTVEAKGRFHKDYCNETKLHETYCENGNVKTQIFVCPNGYKCEDGVCIEEERKCIDSDGGTNWLMKGVTTSGKRSEEDRCKGNELIEYYCEYNKTKSRQHICDYGCKDGACIVRYVDSDGVGRFERGEEKASAPVKEIDECSSNSECDDNNACTSDLCSGTPKKCSNTEASIGCNYNGNCIRIGIRLDGKYCNIDKNINNQKAEDEVCNNNYECLTNICVNSKCISPNLIQRIIVWFKKIF